MSAHVDDKTQDGVAGMFTSGKDTLGMPTLDRMPCMGSQSGPCAGVLEAGSVTITQTSRHE